MLQKEVKQLVTEKESQCQNASGELGNVGDSGRLRCLHVRYTPPFHVCVHIVLAPPTVLGAWSLALVLWLPFGCHLHT